MRNKFINLGLTAVVLCACLSSCKLNNGMDTYEKGTFGYDVDYLSGKDSIILLSSDDKMSQILISPGYQAKVFTSTTSGLDGRSIGWVNYNAFEADQPSNHMNAYGGENRLWIGPEGGQYSVFIAPGKEQVFDNWHTPSAIDTEKWTVKQQNPQSVTLSKDIKVVNYRGTNLAMSIERQISMLTAADVKRILGKSFSDDLKFTAYKTTNSLTNANNFRWTEQTGTVCLWMLDMYPPSDNAYTLVPYNQGAEQELGEIVTSNYFGEVPADRLIDKNGSLVFRTDGKYRSKLGLNPKRSTGIVGNYNFDTNCLTLAIFDNDKQATYLNQEWNAEANPLVGGVLNAYNDGPLEDGSVMGPFLELESSSPAAFLSPGETIVHHHTVLHITGSEQSLGKLTKAFLNIELSDIR